MGPPSHRRATPLSQDRRMVPGLFRNCPDGVCKPEGGSKVVESKAPAELQNAGPFDHIPTWNVLDQTVDLILG